MIFHINSYKQHLEYIRRLLMVLLTIRIRRKPGNVPTIIIILLHHEKSPIVMLVPIMVLRSAEHWFSFPNNGAISIAPSVKKKNSGLDKDKNDASWENTEERRGIKEGIEQLTTGSFNNFRSIILFKLYSKNPGSILLFTVRGYNSCESRGRVGRLRRHTTNDNSTEITTKYPFEVLM